MENRRGILSFLKQNKGAKEEKISKSFLVNGGLLLEELIKTSNGRYCYPIRNFSVKDLLTATNNFDEQNCMGMDSFYALYKGSLEGHLILVKKFKNDEISGAIRDIAITAQMCIHNNVLKLVGCCLEDEALAMVYEHVGGRLLYDCLDHGLGNDNITLSWKRRLRVANEIASVVVYLHTALDRPVVHRNIKPEIFMIDQHGAVKFCDFSFSILIPLGELQVQDQVMGTFGFVDTEYFRSGFVTEKTDVYSFGVLLLVLLSRQKPLKNTDDGFVDHIVWKVQEYFQNDRVNEYVDPRILGDGGGTDEQELQFHAFAALAFEMHCQRSVSILYCGKVKKKKKRLRKVAEELRRIEKSIHLQVPPT